MNNNLEHISVCICTYKRPDLLARSLRRLQDQRTDDLFTYSIEVIDNDSTESARDIVVCIAKEAKVSIEYIVEPRQNIALARNKAIENAKGQLIAFIDDDEFPISTWLLDLFSIYKDYAADGVLGPVKPYFDHKPPGWLIEGRFCERKEFPTGTILHWGDTRTGNVLLDRRLFDKKEDRFGVEFGRTGGEDIEFFKKMINQGRVFVWCNEAITYETVPPERWKKLFHIKKSLRIGGLTGEKARKGELGGELTYLKVLSALCIYGTALPFSFLMGQWIGMRCLSKAAYNVGWVFGFLGLTILRERED